MKKTTQILVIGLILIVFSCGQSNENKKRVNNLKDSTKSVFEKKEQERLKKRKQIDEQNNIDSINFEKILINALKFAELNKENQRFKKSYVETMPDSSYQVFIDISNSFSFTKEKPHLIIRRNTPVTIYIDIFTKTNNQFKKVVSHEESKMTYVNDSIQDINGDGLNDFVVNWYGSSGCCLKAFSNVYILKQDKKTFSNNLEFINPTFSPKENIVRGVCYGHPGETEMYKFRWNGETIDTLEYISYEKNNQGTKTGKIIISKHRSYLEKKEKFKRLNTIPKEYKKIEGYDWFTGEGY